MLAELNRKLGQETTRRERLEQRLNAMSEGMRTLEASFQAVQGERDALRRERSSRWRIILPALLQPAGGDGEAALDLSTRTILYVGGRPHQIPQLKALVERTGARFLHHDGGLEHSAALLPGLISRADPAIPGRLRQPRCRRHAQAAVPAAGEAIPAVASGKPRDTGVVAGGDG